MLLFVIEPLHKKVYLHDIIKLENMFITIDVNKNIFSLFFQICPTIYFKGLGENLYVEPMASHPKRIGGSLRGKDV